MSLRDLLLKPQHEEIVLRPHNTIYERVEPVRSSPAPVVVYGWKRLTKTGYARGGLYENEWASPVEGTVWHDGQLTADHKPAMDNSHGIYLYKTRKQAERSRWGGEVKYIEGTGVIVEHGDEGYRVYHARIIE